MFDTLIEAFAYMLSTVTILSCLFLKVPQIMYVREQKSADGMYLQAMLMELTGFTLTALYNFTNGYSIITYMEYPIILVQLYVLFYYVLKYKNMLRLPIVTIATVAYVSTIVGFGLSILPKAILSYLVPLCMPLGGFAKVMYIYGIIKLGNADAVSLTTWVISVLTNMARIFTVYVDSADSKLIGNFVVSSLLSSGVLATAMYYQKTTTGTGPRKSSARSGFHDD